MKIFSIFLIVAMAMFSISKIVPANQLYQWVDSEGVTHISEEPPSEGGNLVNIMEDSVGTSKPEETAQNQSAIATQKQKGDKY